MFLEENIFSLKSKVIIVTGGARGNGLAIGKSLLDFGATIYFFDRLKSELKNIEKQIHSDKAHFVNMDVTDYAKFANCCGEIFLKENRIDVLVNNAGVTKSLPQILANNTSPERNFKWLGLAISVWSSRRSNDL